MRHGSEQLRDWMARRQVNQREAAQLLDLNEVHFSQILNRLRQPGLANAIKIEQRTGISVESWLLTDVSESEPIIAATASKGQKAKR